MPRILLVDDSAMDRKLFGGLLEKESDFRVESCENGHKAMERIQANRPDVVVTDMQMPDMDGLALVKEVRENHPRIPVILITGHGSEALAAKALKQGAAGYVPKSQSHELLRETVWHVIQLSHAAANYDRLLSCASSVNFEFDLENDIRLIPPLMDLAQRMIGCLGLCDPTACLQVGVAVEHAILNAIYHGNLELSESVLRSMNTSPSVRLKTLEAARAKAPVQGRRVHVAMQISREEARFVVRDEGKGFDVREVSEVGLSTSLTGSSGRGLFLMWAFMDKVSFNEAGNAVTLVKRRETQPQAVKAAPAPESEKKALPEVLGELRMKGAAQPYRLLKNRITIGRQGSCDLVINSTSVSHHHCVLYLYEGWWYVTDLDSTNGVKVNNLAVTQHLVPPGAKLEIGTIQCELNYHPHELGADGITPPVDPF